MSDHSPIHDLRTLPALMTLQQAAVALGCCEKTVRKGVREGSIPALRIGRYVRVSRDGLIRVLQGESIER